MSVTLIDKDPDPVTADLPAEIRVVNGDATSILVLREAGTAHAYALLAATSEDDANIEASRLAVELGVPEVLCRLTDVGRVEEVRAIGARPVTGVMALIGSLTASLPGVAVTTSEVGLGEGEILQVRVMPGSLVIGRPLHEIATREYLVAAIYRDGELVVPHGDTLVEAGDQVLLVGDPITLRAIADYYRLGAAQFPMQFGRSLVVWDPKGDNENVSREARWLGEVGRISNIYNAVPLGAKDRTPDWCRPLPVGGWERGIDPLAAVHPATYVIAPAKTGLFAPPSRGLSVLLDRARSPILMARGTAPWKRILVPVTDSPTSWRGLELAVDIARLVDAKITAVHVTQPKFLGGSLGQERRDAVERQVEEVARLYNLNFEVRVAEGNSIRVATTMAKEHDLLVAARRPGQKDSYFSPDVGLRIASAAACSSILHNVH